MLTRYTRLVGALVLSVALAPAIAFAVPAFEVQDLGFGVPIDMNARGTIVGQDSFAPAQPWVLQDGAKTFLALPAGASSARISRINDQGVVAGESNGRPVVWWPVGGGYVLEELPMPDGATSGTAVDVNADGVVLLTYGTPGRLATGYQYVTNKPYLYTARDGLDDLSTRYTLPAYPDPVDLTDGGRILLKSGDILEPGGSVTPTPAFPPRPEGGYSWIFFSATRLNEAGAFIGVATLSSSMSYAQVVKHVPGAGWKVLGGLSLNVTANGIDAEGNVLGFANYVCPTNFGLVYAPLGGSTYCLDDLVAGGGWSFLGFTAKGALSSATLLPDDSVSPRGRIAAFGYSEADKASRLALLTPVGDLSPPPATQLRATSHPATWNQPYDAITLSWAAAGPLAKAYDIERRGPGEAQFARIARVSASVLAYDDTQVTPLAVYAYRVAAVGLAGPGPYSNEASAQAPAAMDQEAPRAAITSPAEGATVTGTVSVSASFSDNTGVSYASLSFEPNMGSGLVCESYPAAPAATLTLSCKWDTTKVAYQSATATLHAYAHDAIGNWTRTSVSVQVTYGSTKRGGKPRK